MIPTVQSISADASAPPSLIGEPPSTVTVSHRQRCGLRVSRYSGPEGLLREVLLCRIVHVPGVWWLCHFSFLYQAPDVHQMDIVLCILWLPVLGTAGACRCRQRQRPVLASLMLCTVGIINMLLMRIYPYCNCDPLFCNWHDVWCDSVSNTGMYKAIIGILQFVCHSIEWQTIRSSCKSNATKKGRGLATSESISAGLKCWIKTMLLPQANEKCELFVVRSVHIGLISVRFEGKSTH